MTNPVPIPPDILAYLGVLTATHQVVIERLLATLGEPRTRELLAEAQRMQATGGMLNPDGTARTVAEILVVLVEQTAAPADRARIFGVPDTVTPDPAILGPALLPVAVQLGPLTLAHQRVLARMHAVLGAERFQALLTTAEAHVAQGGLTTRTGHRVVTLRAILWRVVSWQTTPREATTIFTDPPPPYPLSPAAQAVAAQLGPLTDSQRGVIQRLVDTLAGAQVQVLLDAAQARLTAAQAGPPEVHAPTDLRGMLAAVMAEQLAPAVLDQIVGRRPPRPGLRGWQRVAARLGETRQPIQHMIGRLSEVVGLAVVEATATEAEAIEAAGGMWLPDGSRKRTLGGIFFHLLKQRVTAEQAAQIPGWWAKLPRDPAAGPTSPPPRPPAAPLVEPALPARPAFVWAERTDIYQDVASEQGGATVKVTLIGRPGKVIEKQDVVITSMRMDKTPSLPKGVPAPPPTLYTVYIARKQWAKVAEAMQDAADVLIVEGVAGYDSEMEGIIVSASNVTTKRLQQAKKLAGTAAAASHDLQAERAAS